MNFRSEIRKVKILQIDKKKIAIRKPFRHFKIPFVLINFGNTFFEYPVLFKFFVVFFVSSRQMIKGSSPRMTFEDLKRDDRFCQDFFRQHSAIRVHVQVHVHVEVLSFELKAILCMCARNKP